MNIHFEELTAPQRAGGIESVTRELITHLNAIGIKVSRSSEQEAAGLPDCVHLHGIWSPRLAGKFRDWNQRGVPCVVSPHGMLEPWALAHKWLKKKLAWHVYQKRLLNRAALLHGTSAREVQQFKNLGLKPPAVLVPWGVTLPMIPNAETLKPETLTLGSTSPSALDSSQGAAPHPSFRHLLPRAEKDAPRSGEGERGFGNRKSEIRTALFVGRIYPVKGLLLLVEAWAKVRPTGWKMKIVGPDEAGHRAEVELLIRQTGVAAGFEFTGPLQGAALREAYESASLFILPSFTENFGMVVAEALAHALPVVTTTGTPWSLLPERGCGWWVSPTVDQIAQALASATRLEEAALQAMGKKGRDVVANEFSWPQAARRMQQLYQRATDGKLVAAGAAESRLV